MKDRAEASETKPIKSYPEGSTGAEFTATLD